ncbi:CCA tRNA nucleotidyltransferase [Alkalihalobacterium sp. APHAB7]|uniref:CCA tRNA nucleotidyltransferase n=1 Tax=Alkalihalobacterium sp. APHAB7 TaxID=3402081 RepID=UPI003AADB03F
MEPLFLIGSKVIHKIKQQGDEAYFVGGAVRDFLLQRPVHDIDITTSAPVERIEELFEVTIPLGKEHGTIIVRLEEQSFEVTTYRSVSDGRSTLAEDLQKRDFTINAMAMNEKMELIDPYNFYNDLENRLIRAVENGVERFVEDPLRMLRACRFSSQLNFEIEKETFDAITKCRGLTERTAIERAVTEFEKLVKARTFSRGLHYMLSSGLTQHISFLKGKEKALEDLAAMKLEILLSLEEVWAAFLYVDQTEQDLISYLKALKKSKQFVHQVVRLQEALNTYRNNGWTNGLIYKIGLENSLKLGRLLYTLHPEENHVHTEQSLMKWHNNLPIKSRRDLNLNGQLLVQAFQKEQGAWIERLLVKVEKAVLAQKVANNTREMIAWLMKERDINDEGQAFGDAFRK